MKKADGLFKEIISFENLYRATKKAFRNKRSKTDVALFSFNLEREILKIQEDLLNNKYKPGKYQIFKIFEPKERTIAASPFRDRVVHHAVCNVLEPIFEKRMISDTFACRKGRGSHAALKRVHDFVKSNPQGYYLKCDVKKYFESIDHEFLKKLLRKIIFDSKVLNLLDTIINHGLPLSEQRKGLPIGNLSSQYFANLYLGELDHYVKDFIGIKKYARYMDDGAFFADSKDELWCTLEKITFFLEESLKLKLKTKATRVGPVQEGVPFLGFRVFPNMIRLQRKNLLRLRKTIRLREDQYRHGVISSEDLNRSVRSVVAHVQHANVRRALRNEFQHSLKDLAI